MEAVYRFYLISLPDLRTTAPQTERLNRLRNWMKSAWLTWPFVIRAIDDHSGPSMPALVPPSIIAPTRQLRMQLLGEVEQLRIRYLVPLRIDLRERPPQRRCLAGGAAAMRDG